MRAKLIKRLNTQNEQIEKEMLPKKPWYMRGGASGKDLPSDYLLQSTPKFESAYKAKPIIIQEHTSTIENIIRLRVLGEDRDDIIPRVLPDVGSSRGEYEVPEISEEKSKLGLGELY